MHQIGCVFFLHFEFLRARARSRRYLRHRIAHGFCLWHDTTVRCESSVHLECHRSCRKRGWESQHIPQFAMHIYIYTWMSHRERKERKQKYYDMKDNHCFQCSSSSGSTTIEIDINVTTAFVWLATLATLAQWQTEIVRRCARVYNVVW